MRLKVRVKQPLSQQDLAQLQKLGCDEKPFIERPFELLFAATDEHEQQLRALDCVVSVDTFKQKLAAIVGEDKVDEVCQLIAAEVIGKYEVTPLPDFASFAEIERLQELDNDTAVKNALRREQRRVLGLQK